MKRSVFLFLALAVLLSVSACGGKKAEPAYPIFWTWLDLRPNTDFEAVCQKLNDVGIDGILLNAPTPDDYRRIMPTAHAHGITVFRNVEELRAKESDRLDAIVKGLAQLGVDAWTEGDDLFIEGQPDLQVPEGLVFDSRSDHRLAMTWALVGLTGKVPVDVTDFGSVDVCYPEFLEDIEKLCR